MMSMWPGRVPPCGVWSVRVAECGAECPGRQVSWPAGTRKKTTGSLAEPENNTDLVSATGMLDLKR